MTLSETKHAIRHVEAGGALRMVVRTNGITRFRGKPFTARIINRPTSHRDRYMVRIDTAEYKRLGTYALHYAESDEPGRTPRELRKYFVHYLSDATNVEYLPPIDGVPFHDEETDRYLSRHGGMTCEP